MVIALLIGSLLTQPSSTVHGAAWEDLRFPLTSATPGPSHPPQFNQFADDGAGSIGVRSYAFEDEAVNEDRVFFIAQLPHSWGEGTSIDAHVHVSPEDATTCNYRVCVEYLVSSKEDSWPANTSSACVTFASDEAATAHQYEDIGSISMSGHTISAVILGVLYRDSTNAADTCNGKDLWIHELDFHYRRVRPGSRQETVQ